MIPFLLSLLTGISLPTASQPLSVTITDYENRQATLFVAIFDEDDGFPKPKR